LDSIEEARRPRERSREVSVVLRVDRHGGSHVGLRAAEGERGDELTAIVSREAEEEGIRAAGRAEQRAVQIRAVAERACERDIAVRVDDERSYLIVLRAAEDHAPPEAAADHVLRDERVVLAEGREGRAGRDGRIARVERS